jgi:hypothetical protein
MPGIKYKVVRDSKSLNSIKISNTSSAEPLIPHVPFPPPTPAEDHLIDEERDHAPNYHQPIQQPIQAVQFATRLVVARKLNS